VDADAGRRVTVHGGRLHRGATTGVVQEQHERDRRDRSDAEYDEVVRPSADSADHPRRTAERGRHGAPGRAPDQRRDRLEHDPETDRADEHEIDVFSLERSQHALDEQTEDRGDDDAEYEREPKGEMRCQVERGDDVGTDHENVAVGEVHQPHGPVHDRESERDQRVDGTEAEPTDQGLNEHLHVDSSSVR
jgi:hypothetical protein